MTVRTIILEPKLNDMLNSEIKFEFQEIEPEILIEKDLQNLSDEISKNSNRDFYSLISRLEIYRSFSVFTFTPDIKLTEQIAAFMK